MLISQTSRLNAKHPGGRGEDEFNIPSYPDDPFPNKNLYYELRVKFIPKNKNLCINDIVVIFRSI